MNFKSYIEKNEPKVDNNYSQNNKKVNNNSSKLDEDNIEKMYNNYSKLNQQELLNEFIKESKLAKNNGTFSDEKIQNMKEVLSPYLTDEQKQYFDDLINMVK